MSLRRVFTVFATVLGLLGILGGGGLILFTTSLARTTGGVEGAVESVRLSEEFEIELLGHRGMENSIGRVSSEERLRQYLTDAARFIGSPQEEALLARLRTELEAYVQAVHRAAATGGPLAAIQESSRLEFEEVFESSRELIQTNVEQSRALTRTAASWDRVANLVGTAIIVLLVGGLGAIALFLRRAVFGPAVAIADALERYSRGDRASRAPEEGAAEFHSIASRFNDLTSTLERQREHQLAFLAGVAHDIRNPLAALKMASAVISPDRALPPEDRIRQSYLRVQRQIDRLERMAFDLMDAARIEAGWLELHLETCDLRELARNTIDLFAPTAPDHRISLEAPRDPVPVTCDPIRVEQVLNNLVSNAIKYSPRGGQITVAVEAHRAAAVLSVADEGVGVPAEDAAHIFEPFRRTRTSKESFPGTGLGLFVAQRIVEAHGGRISVESAPGKGSVFRVQLPARLGAETGSTASRPATDGSAPPPH